MFTDTIGVYVLHNYFFFRLANTICRAIHLPIWINIKHKGHTLIYTMKGESVMQLPMLSAYRMRWRCGASVTADIDWTNLVRQKTVDSRVFFDGLFSAEILGCKEHQCCVTGLLLVLIEIVAYFLTGRQMSWLIGTKHNLERSFFPVTKCSSLVGHDHHGNIFNLFGNH